MIFTIRQLEVLVATADAANFSRAAESIGISQPSLSETIKRIETELGIVVFSRSTRAVALTPQGLRIVTIARLALRDYRHAITIIADETQQASDKIAVAALPSIVSTCLGEAIYAFRKIAPNVSIEVFDVQHERAVGLLNDGSADIAITFMPDHKYKLAFEPFGSDALHLVCHKDDPLALKARISWTDLAGVSFVGLSQVSSVRKITDGGFLSANIMKTPDYEVEQIPSAIALVAAGLGVTALPALTLNMFTHKSLVTRPLIRPAIARNIGAVTLPQRTRSKATTLFLERIKQSLREKLARSNLP
jgi:LysR family transcriptional regulator, carnitine catabolism transcriptional activator